MKEYMRPEECEKAVLAELGGSLHLADHRYQRIVRDIWFEYCRACSDLIMFAEEDYAAEEVE